jgi:hypothetical protein
MSLVDLFAKLFSDPKGGLAYLIEAPMTIETAAGWLIVAFTGMVTLGFFVWILMKITGR